MKAKLLCLYDEGAIVNTPLIGAKGLSILIDVDEQRTLFDTGRRWNYLRHNMDLLDIKAESIDRIVISHGHKDHTGALNGFLEEREGAVKILSGEGGWLHKATVKGGIRFSDSVVVSDENRTKASMETVKEWTQLSENLFVIPLPPAIPDGHNKIYVNEKWVDDTMSDELALVLTTRKGLVLITGCSHVGIMNVMEWVSGVMGRNIHAVIGGIHTIKMKKDKVNELADSLKETNSVFYFNHCTTKESITAIRTKIGMKNVRDFFVGTELVLDL